MDRYVPQRSDPLESTWTWNRLGGLASDSSLRCFELGKEGTIWLGYNKGVSSFDGKRQRFYPEISIHGIRRILAASNGNVYVTATGRLWKFSNGQWFRYPNHLRLPSTSDVGALEDKEGQIWIAANRRLCRVLEDKVLFLGRVASEPITDFDIDSEGNFWILESPSGTVRKLGIKGNRFNELAAWPDLMRLPESELNKAEVGPHTVADIHCSTDGSIWVANASESVPLKSLSRGDSSWVAHDLAKLGGSNRIGSLAKTHDGVLRALGGNIVHSFANDRWSVYSYPSLRTSRAWAYLKQAEDGTVWILDRFVGLSQIDYTGKRWRQFDDLFFEIESADGSLWFLDQRHGIVKKDGESGQWVYHESLGEILDAPSSIFQRSDGKVWAVGAHVGQAAASVWDGRNWQLYLYPELGDMIVGSLHAEARDGALFLGGRRFNELGKRTKRQPFAVFEPNEDRNYQVSWIPSNLSLRAKQLFDGRVAVGGSDIFVWNQDEFQSLLGEARSALRFRRVPNFEMTENGDVWIANWGAGVARLSEGRWTYIDERSGLSSDHVSDLLLLENGHLAALTAKGLDRFDGKSWYPLPIPWEEIASGVAHLSQSLSGALWVGIESDYWDRWMEAGNRHERTLKSFRFKPNQGAPETEIRLLSSQDPYARSRLIGWDGQGHGFGQGDKNLLFSYRVDQKEWSSYSSKQEHFFENLEPGVRVFEARAMDEDGNVDPSPAVLKLEILVPFWETRWFFILVILIAVTFAAMIYGLLWQRYRHVAALEGVRERFLVNLSHELRSPLLLIVAPLEKLVAGGTKDAASHKVASTALRGAKRLCELIDQLLEIRKLDLKPKSSRVEACDVMSFVRAVAEDFDRLSRTAGQRVVFQSTEESRWLLIDKDAYRKILDNLVLNAIKHSKSGDVTSIALEIDVAAEEGACTLRFSVEDEGEGISQKALPRIFEPFYWEKKSRFQRLKSFGIGLAFVRELVENLGGSVTVVSPADGGSSGKPGSRFDVVLPNVSIAEAIVEENKEEAGTEFRASKESGDRAKRPLLLIADDDAEVCCFLAEELGSSYDVFQASDGEEAFRIARTRMPDLVLADVAMPGLSGIELCRKLQELEATSHIPVLLQSASTDDGVRASAMEAGAVDFLTKPFSMTTFENKVENLLNSRDRFARRLKVRLLNDTEASDSNEEGVFAGKIRDLLDHNLSNQEFGAEALARELGLGSSSCYRRFMSAFGMSPSNFIKRHRLERSLAFLEMNLTASEVALKIGYVEPSSYNRAFKKYFGHTPANYKKILAERDRVNANED